MSEFTQAAGKTTKPLNPATGTLRGKKLMLLDFDGTLADGAETGAMEVMRPIIEEYFLTKLGVKLEDKDFEGMTGKTAETVVETILTAKSKTFLPEDKKQLLKDLHQARIEQKPNKKDVAAIAGVKEYLEFLRTEGIAFAIVTNSETERVVNFLRAAGLLEYFIDDNPARATAFGAFRIVSAHNDCDDEGKPSGRPYQVGMQRYGAHLDPNNPTKDVGVLEDSATGVEAARNAGIADVMGITASTTLDSPDGKDDKRNARRDALNKAGAARVYTNYDEVLRDAKGEMGSTPQFTSVAQRLPWTRNMSALLRQLGL